jgi:hypothetical protein
MGQHDHMKQKAHAKMAGKKGKAKAQAFLDDLVENMTALRAQAETQTKEEILASADEAIALATANSAEFAAALAS